MAGDAFTSPVAVRKCGNHAVRLLTAQDTLQFFVQNALVGTQHVRQLTQIDIAPGPVGNGSNHGQKPFSRLGLARRFTQIEISGTRDKVIIDQRQGMPDRLLPAREVAPDYFVGVQARRQTQNIDFGVYLFLQANNPARLLALAAIGRTRTPFRGHRHGYNGTIKPFERLLNTMLGGRHASRVRRVLRRFVVQWRARRRQPTDR